MLASDTVTPSVMELAGSRNRAMARIPRIAAAVVSSVIDCCGLSSKVRELSGSLGMILELHNVCDASELALNTAATITTDHLDRIVRFACSQGWPLLTMDQVLDCLVHPIKQRAPFIALSFDDGYLSSFSKALPVLRSYNAPMAVNVVTGYLDRSTPHWWLALENFLRHRSYMLFGKGKDVRGVSIASMRERRSHFEKLAGELRRDLVLGQAPLHEFWVNNDADPLDLCDAELLSWDQLAVMARDPLVTIGGHTKSHPLLAKLPDDEAREEIIESKKVIEERLGTRLRHFAYPFGGRQTFGIREVKYAQDAGYLTAVSTRVRHLSLGERNALYSLPRVPVRGAWSSLASIKTAANGLSFGRRSAAPAGLH